MSFLSRIVVHFMSCLSLLIVLLSVQFVAAKPAVPSTSAPTPLPAATQEFLATLPSPDKTQAQVLAKLAEQIGGARSLPPYPANALLLWNARRFAAAGEDAAKVRPLVYDALNIAQSLSRLSQTHEKRRGMALANSAVLRVAVVLRDPALACRVYEGFLLPHLDVAPTDLTLNGSRYNVLREAAITYQTAKEQQHWNTALEALLPLALEADRENPTRQPSADWVFIKMADRDRAEGRDAKALEELKRVRDADLKAGLQPLIEQLAAKLSPIAASKAAE